MADPTHAEIWAQIGDVVDLFDTINTDVAGWITKIDAAIAALEGEYTPDVRADFLRIRAAASSILSPESMRSALSHAIFEAGRLYGYPERDVFSLMGRIYDTFVAQSYTLNRREWSFGSISVGGSNVGNGTVLRLTVDENNYPLSATHAEVKTFECVADQNSGADEHEEVFEARGVEAEPDFLVVAGSGLVTRRFRAQSARDSDRLLSNPSFSLYTGPAATPTAITDWTVTSDIANYAISTATTFRDFVGDTTPASLTVKSNDTISQIIKDTRNARLNPNVPYWFQVAVYRPTGVTGNVIVKLGSKSQTVALSTLTVDEWSIVGFLSAPGQNCWLKNFTEADLKASVETTSLSGGNIQLDDALLLEGQRWNGHWWWIVPKTNAGAAYVAFLRDDTFSFTDSVSGEAKNAWALWRAGLGYLPDATGAGESIADP